MSVTKSTKKWKMKEAKRADRAAADPTRLWPVAWKALITAVIAWVCVKAFATAVMFLFFIPLIGLLGYLVIGAPFIIGLVFGVKVSNRATKVNPWGVAVGTLGILLWFAYGVFVFAALTGGFEF